MTSLKDYWGKHWMHKLSCNAPQNYTLMALMKTQLHAVKCLSLDCVVVLSVILFRCCVYISSNLEWLMARSVCVYMSILLVSTLFPMTSALHSIPAAPGFIDMEAVDTSSVFTHTLHIRLSLQLSLPPSISVI